MTNDIYKTLICLNTAQCPFYENWSKVTGGKKVNVIIEVPEGTVYQCLAHLAHDDSIVKEGIPESYEFKKKVPGNIRVECSHITILNTLDKILEKLQ